LELLVKIMNKNLSIHLQNFPDLSFIPNEANLVSDMDMVRNICSTALFIRDSQNLRVRLPLNKLTIIGQNASRMLDYKEIIADEVNVKNIEVINEIGDLAELKLQINFKKVGVKLGSKMKEVSSAARDGKWKKVGENKIDIAGVILENDEFEIKLTTKDSASTAPLPSNDCLIQLDTKITKELEEEGIARDIVRAIQQNRKDANLNISDHIKIQLFSSNQQFLTVARFYENYIKEQTLTDKINILKNNQIEAKYKFNNKIEETELNIGID